MKKLLIYFVSACCLISVIFFTYLYVRNESPVYTFDYSGYFENYKLMGSLFKTNIAQYFETMISSIQNSDYNYSSVFFLLPFYLILGTSRVAYITSLTVLYLFPSIILISYSFINLIKKDYTKKEQIKFFVFGLMLTFMYTRLWSPTLRGLSDIVGIIPVIIAYLLVKKRPLLESQKNIFPILLGVVVYMPFLFRRWYMFYIIGFYLSNLFVDLAEFRNISNKKNVFFSAFKNYFISGITTLFCAIFFQLPLLKHIFIQNYSDSYSGYQTKFLTHIIRFYKEFGIVIILLAILGIVISFYKKKYRKDTAFCFLNVVIFWITFGTIQTMGVHHYLGISFWMITLAFIGIIHIYNYIKNQKLKNVFLLTVLMIFGINFMTTFVLRNTNIPLISQSEKYYKLRYDNFSELERLISDIKILMIDNQDLLRPNMKFSVLAESHHLSDNLIDLLGDTDIRDNIVYATHIDSRDGINFNSLLTSYIVVTSESQVSFRSKGQYVIEVPNQMIYHSFGIGEAYSQVSGPYVLDGNVEAFIFKKNRAFKNSEVKQYLDSFFEIYPNWRDKYDDFDEALLMSNLTLGSKWGNFRRIDKNTFYFYPGITKTEIDIPVNKKIGSLVFEVNTNHMENIPESGIVSLTIMGDKKKLFSEIITPEKKKKISLNLSEISNLKFLVDGEENLVNDWLYMKILEMESS